MQKCNDEPSNSLRPFARCVGFLALLTMPTLDDVGKKEQEGKSPPPHDPPYAAEILLALPKVRLKFK